MNSGSEVALRVEDLAVWYETERGTVRAIEGLTFSVKREERLGIVGESGSGKSTLALALLRVLRPPGRIVSGHAFLGETDLFALGGRGIRDARFSRIAMIPQGAMNSLNPVMRIREMVLDTMRAHERSGSSVKSRRWRLGTNRRETDRVAELLESVGLDPSVSDRYPHELSGGMKQRVAIAIATALSPEVIIADEPTSALDVVVQREVMATLDSVTRRAGTSVILIGHDMGLMAQFVDRIAVMYAGQFVEVGPTAPLFTKPIHPYTELLISTLPKLGKRGDFHGIPGLAPSLLRPPSGCRFHPRCPIRKDECSEIPPQLTAVSEDRQAACLVRVPGR